MSAGPELDTFGHDLLDTAIDQVLFHLEIGNAVAQQAANAVGLLEYRDVVTGARKLLGGGETGGTGPDHCNALPAALLWRLGFDPAFAERMIDDAFLDLLDGHGWFVDAEHAGGFAGRGADAPGELRKIVGRVK